MMSLGGQKKRPLPIFFDITPSNSSNENPQIYRAVYGNLNPITKPYSNFNEWHNLVAKNLQISEDELVGKLLNLKNRNWVLEQLKLQNELNSQSP